MEDPYECPFCGQLHPENAHFCPVTGKPLPINESHLGEKGQKSWQSETSKTISCPNCGAQCPETAKFCSFCSTKLFPSHERISPIKKGASPGHRRNLVVIWSIASIFLVFCLVTILLGVWYLRDHIKDVTGVNLNLPLPVAWFVTHTPGLPESATFTVTSTLTLTPGHSPTFTLTPIPTESPAVTLPSPSPMPTLTPTLTLNKANIYMPLSGQPQGEIVYICQIFRDENRNQICIINADGSGQKRISTDDNRNYLYAVLTPDGQKVLYSGRIGPVYQIYEMNLNGSNVRQLTNNAFGSYDADISPDGNSIVFVKIVDASDQSNAIWIMDRNGDNQYQVFGPPDGIGWDPVWSPDGKQILFMRDLNNNYQLFKVNIDGTNLKQITNINLLRGRSDWSPDGDNIATYSGSEWHRDVYVMNQDGTNLQQVTNGGNAQAG